MIWQALNGISTDYVFGGSRYEMHDTDCSGMMCAAFYQLLGVDPRALGTWTGSQWASDETALIWQGETPDLPWDEMREDDLIFTSCYSGAFDTENGSHVGLYTGNPQAPFISHFMDGTPMITAVDGVYGGNERFFGVKRWKGFMNDTWKDTSYQEPYPTGADMGTRLVWIDKRLSEMANIIWEYNYENTAPFGNMYNCIVQTNLFVQDLKRQLEKQDERLSLIERKLNELV